MAGRGGRGPSPELGLIEALNATVYALMDTVDENAATEVNDVTEVNVFYLMWAGVTVFFMQAGFGMLEVGSVRAKNAKNILLKNMLDACLGAIIWYLLGFGFAYGDSSDGGFIGSGASGFALHPEDKADDYTAMGYDWVTWFFQYVFAAAAATIVSGAVAERAQLGAYLIYTCIITGFIYPVVVHWVWDTEGFMSAFNSNEGDAAPIEGGMIDFAGSGVVHMTGGVAALMGALIIKERTGRWDLDEKGNYKGIPGHSSVLAALGTFILWFGWYGFNCGSTLGIHTYGVDAARVAVTTTLSPGAAAVTVVITKRIQSGKAGAPVWDLGATCNGVLAGLVSITAGCSTVEAWASILIGIIGGWVYMGASALLVKCKIDDPLDAFPVHGACGFWGVFAVGLFCTEEYGYNLNGHYGAFYGGDGTLLGVELLGLILIILWVVVTAGLMFKGLDLAGILRVDPAVEKQGMDESKHGGTAYEMAMAPQASPQV